MIQWERECSLKVLTRVNVGKYFANCIIIEAKKLHKIKNPNLVFLVSTN
jgi:hypothetical protein